MMKAFISCRPNEKGCFTSFMINKCAIIGWNEKQTGYYKGLCQQLIVDDTAYLKENYNASKINLLAKIQITKVEIHPCCCFVYFTIIQEYTSPTIVASNNCFDRLNVINIDGEIKGIPYF